MTAPLPNPSIVFVPLDVLTADELNQICQNVNYLAGLFPVNSGNINSGAVTGDKIAANAITSDKISNTTGNTAMAPTNRNVLRIGNRKIMWGSVTVNAVPTGTDKSQDVTFPESFASLPKVIVSPSGWYGIVWAETDSVNSGALTTSKFKLVVRHDFGSNLDIKVDYVAIG